MSHPVRACLILKSVAGDQAAFDRLVQIMERNLKHGAFSIWPCECDPPCPPATNEQVAALDERLLLKLEERRRAKE